MTQENEKLELWTITDNAQYRLQNLKFNDNIQLTFWVPGGTKTFNTEYEKLLKMLESADKSLYSPKSI